MALTELTKVTGPGIHTLSNVLSHNIKSSGIITATKFSGPLDSIGGNFAGVITATNGVFSGNISAVDGNFSGNVSVGGTLTYEDVTNIDSVGIITARDGLKVLGGGANIVGVVTATSFVGSGAALTGIDATAIKDSGGNVKVQAQASGAVYTGIHTFNSDLDVDGHTNLDNVSIAGVTTMSGNLRIQNVYPIIELIDTNNNDDFEIRNADGIFIVRDATNSVDRLSINSSGGASITGSLFVSNGIDNNGDLDVDGHTNLDNVSIAGVTTFASNISVGSSIAVGTGVTIETNGQGTFTGIVTASSFKLSDGSNVGGVESDSRLNTVGGTLSGADIVIGGNSGSSGNDNTLFGWSAGRFIALGDGNSCFGVTAGRNIGAGLWNTFIGGQAGRNMSSSYNTCVGYQASYMNNAQGYTVAFGYQAGYNATNSGRLTAIGYQAGKAHTGGNGNTYLGYQAGHLNTSGDRNVVIGDLTVSGSSDYNRVTVIGAGAAGGFGSNANNNTVVGYGAASSTLTGENNTIIGNGANPSGNVSNEITLGNSSVSHFRIPGIGVSFSEGGGVVTGIMTASSFKLLDGSTVGFSPDAQNNLFAGTDAGASLNSSSNNNVLFGQDAGDSITSGYENVCIGLRAGQAITDTRRNTCVGSDAGRNFSAGDSTFIGWNAGASASSNGNICVGHNAGVEANGGDTAVGYSCGPTGSYSGTQNVCYGRAAGNGLRQNASDNTIIGPGAGRNAATGQVNIEGNYNIILGAEASLSSTTVGNECVIGAVYGHSKTITHFRVPGIGVTFATNGNHISGITTFSNNISVIGEVAATTKSFVIDHPTKENHQLRYACLEGPENSVYVRGKTSESVIELPDYWEGLVHDDSITVNVTSIGNYNVWVESINNNSVTIGSDGSEYFYTVFAERKDVDKLKVEVAK